MPEITPLHHHRFTIPALIVGTFLISFSVILFGGAPSEYLTTSLLTAPEEAEASSTIELPELDSVSIDLLNAPITVITSEGSFISTPNDLGLGYNGKFFFDQNEFLSAVSKAIPQLSAPVDAQLKVDNYRRTKVIPDQPGQIIDLQKFEGDITQQLKTGIFSGVSLSANPATASYTTDEANSDATTLQEMLKHKMNFFYTEAIEKTNNFPMPFEPSWVTVRDGQFIFNEPDIRAYIKDTIATELNRPRSDAIIKSLPKGESLYAEVEGRAFDGWEVDEEQTYQNFKEKISQKLYDIPVEVKITQGKVINETGVDLGGLTQLSQGKSGYWGSALGRKANIEKGLNERLANILIAPGEEFSFNKFIGEVDGAHGWKPALAIFGGTELVPVPGGGLCQVSTTFYRAIVRAGLEVLEKSNHTLYITYYEEYGNGLDAAVYPGSKDFRFRNNTDHYLFIESYTYKDIGYVDIYGTPIHKNVELIGPFYHGKVPEKFKAQVDPNWNEIAWIQRITDFGGTITDNVIMGRYKTAPRKWYGFEEPPV